MSIYAYITRRQILWAFFLPGFAYRARRLNLTKFIKRNYSNARATAGGRCWYLDNDIPSSGDGKTWSTAWKGFGDIKWKDVDPGDTIYLSGGKSGRNYMETLIIDTSGEAGAPVTITAGVDAGHAGEVTIDAEGVRSNAIVIKNQNHLTISHLTIQNTANDANLRVRDVKSGVLIDSIKSYSGSGSGGDNDCRCFDIRNCIASPGNIAVTLQNCTANTPTSTTSQTDALWTSGNSGVLVQNNRFTVANTDPTGHSDCIQSYNDVSVTYRCNFLAHPHGGVNNHGFMVSDVQAGGTLYFYNNVIVMGSTPGLAAGRPEAAIFRQTTMSDHTGTVKIWNNTIYGGCPGYHCGSTIDMLPASDEFKNNIICMPPNSVAAYEFQVGNLAIPANTDYNLVYHYSRGLVVYSCGNTVGAVRSTTSTIAGRVYFEVQLAEGVGSSNTMVGIGNVKAELTQYIGASTNSLGWEWSHGGVYHNGMRSHRQGVPAGSSDIVAFAFDFLSRKFWISNLTRHSGWNAGKLTSQDPGSGVGGYPIPFGLLGPYFIMISVGRAGDGVVLNAGATPFLGTVPASFIPWGTATALNPADIGGPATLTAPVAAIAGQGFRDRASWTALGYDQHGIGSDPLFVDPMALNFRLGSTSPALHAGLFLPAVTSDYAGKPRPHHAPYSLGAFQG